MDNRSRAFGKKTKGPEDAWGTLKRLLRLIMTTQPLLWLIAFISIIVSALASVVGTLFLQRLVDDYILPLLKVDDPKFGPLLTAIIWMAAIYLLGVVATYVYTQIMPALGQRIQKRLRDQLFVHMQTLPVGYFDSHSYGDLMSRYTNDVDTLTQLISQSFPQFLSSIFNLVFVIVGMLTLSPVLTLISVGIFLLSLGVIRFLSKRSSGYFQEQQRQLGQLNGFIEENLTGLKVIKVFSHESVIQNQFETVNESLRKDASAANGYATMLFPIMGNLGNLLYVLIALVGGALAVQNVLPLTLGAIAAFLQLSRNFSQPIAQISQQLNAIIMALAGSERLFQVLDEKPEIDEGQVTLVKAEKKADGTLGITPTGSLWAWQNADTNKPLIPLKGHIVFDGVWFSYDHKTPVFEGINFEAKPGAKVALVGTTGAGKTTMINLLTRFYELDQGRITYDGIDIRQIKKADLRHSLGMVLQETNLFTGTIADNIRMGKPDASMGEITAAAKLANADVFIRKLSKGYDTVLENGGASLSQGQRQLLAIARAAVADPAIMILDEATSSIDTQTERLVQSGMDNLMANRTTFAIAHRLSTIFNADLILVVEAGRIIERGNHEALMAQKGRYYDLYMGKTVLE